MTSLELQVDRQPVRPEGIFFTRVMRFFAVRRQRRAQHRALQDLAAFSPHLLNDLGITQADIGDMKVEFLK